MFSAEEMAEPDPMNGVCPPAASACIVWYHIIHLCNWYNLLLSMGNDEIEKIHSDLISLHKLHDGLVYAASYVRACHISPNLEF